MRSLRAVLCAGFILMSLFGVVTAADTPVPVVKQIAPPLDGWREEGFVYISGDNIKGNPANTTVRINGKSAVVDQISGGSIRAKLPKDVTSGDVVVTISGVSSKAFYLEIPRPEIHYLYRNGGVVPGQSMEIGGSKLLTPGFTTEVFLGEKVLDVLERDFDNQRILVQLPNEPINADLKVLSRNLNSNLMRLDIAPPFYVASASVSGSRSITVLGLFPSDQELSVYLDNTRLAIERYSKDQLTVTIPENTPVGDGFVSVRYGNKKGTGVPLVNNQTIPAISGIGNLKRMTQSDGNNSSKVYYELEVLLYGEGYKTDIYMNGRKAEVLFRGGSSVTIMTEPVSMSDVKRPYFPLTGTLVPVVSGYKGREYAYNLTDRMGPVLYRVETPEGIGSRKKVILHGDRLGESMSSVVLTSSMGLQLDENRQPLISSHSAGRIEFRLPDIKSLPTTASFSVTVRGTRSNEITFPVTEDRTSAERNPKIEQIRYPEGHMVGDQIVIKAQGLSSFKGSNHVLFGNIKVQPEAMNGTEELMVKIPVGAKTGPITLDVQGKISDTAEVVVVSERMKELQWFFEQPDMLRQELSGKPVPVATLGVRNLLNDVMFTRLRMDISWQETADKSSPYAVSKTGLLPIEYVELSLGKTTYRSSIKRQGSSHYVEFNGVFLPVSETKQQLKLTAQFAPYVTTGSMLEFQLDPQDRRFFEASFVDGRATYTPLTPSDGKGITSPTITLVNGGYDCIEDKNTDTYCDIRLGNRTPLVPTPTTQDTQREPTEAERDAQREVEDSTTQADSEPQPPREEPTIPRANTLPFADTASISWAQEALERLYGAGVISGYQQGGTTVFRPTQTVTRAELLKMILEAQGISVAQVQVQRPFTDVYGSEWFAPYVEYAKDQGMIQGYADGNFRPNAPVSRAEAVKILLSVAGETLKGVSVLELEFDDISGWMIPWVQKAADLGMVKGYSDGSFRPNAPLNRVEAAQMVLFFLK